MCTCVCLYVGVHMGVTHTSASMYLCIAPVLMLVMLRALQLPQPPSPVWSVLLHPPLRDQPVHSQQQLCRPPPVPVGGCVCV